MQRREDVLGGHRAAQHAVAVDEHAASGGCGQGRVEDGAQARPGARDGAAAVQGLAGDRSGQLGRLYPADGASVGVDDEKPRVRCRGPSLLRGGAEGDGRLRRQRQVRGLAEAQGSVTAVAPDEVGDEVVHRIGEQPGRLGDLGQLPADAKDRHQVARA